MQKNAGLIDKLIIFICCSIVYICQDNMSVTIMPILISVIFSGFISYFDNNRLKTVLTTGFSFLFLFIPELAFFMPLLVYDMIFYKYQYFNLLAIIPFMHFAKSAPVQIISVILALIFISALVKYCVEVQLKLQEKYNELSDTAREMSIKLSKQNKDLIEKQDYELHLATLNERNRIAREIHDNVGHLLSSAILQTGALLMVTKDENLRNCMKDLNNTLSQAMNNIRNSVHELYDESVDLNVKIKELVKQFTFCELSYEYSIYSNPDKKLKYAFISIIKEALSNIARHSNADRASIVLREHPAFYQLMIRDNGTVKNYSTDEGIGIKNMIDRVHSFNGNINITTKNGFEIFISIPKEGLTA